MRGLARLGMKQPLSIKYPAGEVLVYMKHMFYLPHAIQNLPHINCHMYTIVGKMNVDMTFLKILIPFLLE